MGYGDLTHPLQIQIKNIIKILAECEQWLRRTYCIPLYNLALTYLKFVCPEQVEDLPLTEDVWLNIIIYLLNKIKYSNTDTINRLRSKFPQIRYNDSGIPVGGYYIREGVDSL
ncbi:hypothetical protein J2S74_003257 [Evansella vedderi]|uniref:Uncharacterized protein n=1 Tax=Evansella vedderi TaxID=38282 RepID=A0ABT9ZXA9_9BACI|nr:hypothetical protein [Evansella vedderi]MDQ0255873.1 hypothetical protein [Evansella vedderi]